MKWCHTLTLVSMLVLATSCNQIKHAEILFPASGAQVKNPVILGANHKVAWKINNHVVGEGVSWKGILPAGKHNIEIYVNESKSQQINIEVEEDFPLHQITNGTNLLQNNKLNLPEGKFRVVLANLYGETTLPRQLPSEWDSILHSKTKELLETPQKKPILRSLPSQAETERTFQMLSLQENSAIQVPTQNIFSGEHTLAYVDKSVSSEYWPDILEIVQDFDRRIVHIDRKIFGEFSDVDANGRVILLFSDKLNKSEKAVGFFYAGDILKRDESNPESNEAEILYLGIPDPKDANFSKTALKATACHELQHLINFSQKTLPYIEDSNAPLEEISINEGLSHFAEDLCGFNVSGGNVIFAARYLRNHQQTSLDGLDLLHRGDTIERRGAMYLFLRYLFEYQGSAKFENSEIQDLGGIRWLHSVIKSNHTGLENVTDATKISLTQALWNWWWTLALADVQEQTWVPNHLKYRPMQYVPETQDFRGINLMLGEKTLPPNIQFSLQGLPISPTQHAILPKHGFQMLEITGPSQLNIPSSWGVQVLRLQ